METKRIRRKLAAILSADVKDYSRLMRDDEEATVKTLNAYQQVMETLIRQHYGRVVDSPGDNLLAEFNSVVEAVQSAVAIQKEIRARNAGLSENRRMLFRIGINLGDVIVDEGRLYGDGVNIAARLEGLAEAGGICISRTAYDQIEDKLPFGYEYMGEKRVKNFPKPVHAYRVLLEPEETFRGVGEEKRTEARKQPREPLHITIERHRGRREWSPRKFSRSLRAYLFVVAVLLVINLLKDPHRLWFLWIAIPWGALLLIRWHRLRGSPKNGQPAGDGSGHEGPGTQASPGRPRTLFVQVESRGGGPGEKEKVNIRIPLQVLRTGVKLGAILPAHAREKINEALKEHGLDVDFFSMDREKLEEMLDSMGELQIEVEREEKTVRIFCR